MADRHERSGRPIGDTEGADADGQFGQSRALSAAQRRADDREHESDEERADRESRERLAEPRSPRSTQWHSSRAQNKRELFQRVNKCGTAEAAKVTLVCRDCKTSTTIDVGCGSRWFCPRCRVETVKKFRGDFDRKRLGLITTATRAGLTRRRQKRSERWGERMLTLTLPHKGGAGERIEVLCDTWARFFRLLRDELRPKLQRPSGITIGDLPRSSSRNGLKLEKFAAKARKAKKSLLRYSRRRRGLNANGSFPKRPKRILVGPLQWRDRYEAFDDGHELSLWDMFTYLRVLEWTPGKDGEGHPHFHVWFFSQYLDQGLIKTLWERAYFDVRRARLPIGPIQHVELIKPDLRAANKDPGLELVKYLTKDWELSDTGAKRAYPEVFSLVYAKLDGKRLRQTSAGFSDWAVEKFNACPCCWFEKANGDHWARIDITHSLEEVTEPIGREYDPNETTATPLAGASRYHELRDEFEQKRDAAWTASLELQILRARVRAALKLPEKKPTTRHQQLTLGDHQHGERRSDRNDSGTD